MDEEKKIFWMSIIFSTGFLLVLWIIKILEFSFDIHFANWGVFPRESFGLIGILTFPLVHADFNHLISNSLPLLFLITGLCYFYPKSSKMVFSIIYFGTGIFVWLFARPSFHIGASGLIYGIASFLFFSGVIRRDTRSITLALLVTFLYGGLIWGILPLENHVSWEGHLFGALMGIVSAFVFRKSDPYKKYDWEDEPNADSDKKPEISYD